jgi:hypothetical protein
MSYQQEIIMSNEKLKDIALKILNKTSLPKNDHATFDPFTILMIISIILTLVRILQECNKKKLSNSCSLADKCSLYGEEIKEYSIRKGWFTKMRIKKLLRREMKKEDYEKYSLSIVNSILNTGETLTDEEIQTLVEASNV